MTPISDNVPVCGFIVIRRIPNFVDALLFVIPDFVDFMDKWVPRMKMFKEELVCRFLQKNELKYP